MIPDVEKKKSFAKPLAHGLHETENESLGHGQFNQFTSILTPFTPPKIFASLQSDPDALNFCTSSSL